ncbi:MAG: methyltransferase domain-containing protein [Acidimicrobiales bacterium]|nr:methyltransferase domain-containing protein [Acidimicrobiales bacterium]
MAAFDALAADYDVTFSETILGGVLRARVHERLAHGLPVGGRVLELNCGTGVDAVWLARRGHSVLATDVSPAMVAHAALAARRAGAAIEARIDTAVLALEDLSVLSGTERPFDAALSNFGGLNCVADVTAVLADLAALVRPGGRAWLCIMGPLVPWEWVWFAGRGDWSSARRRLRRNPRWRGLPLQYPTVRSVRRAARATGWAPVRVDGLAALVPPPFAESFAGRHPRLVAGLDRLERRLAHTAPVVWTADHYLIELVHR